MINEARRFSCKDKLTKSHHKVKTAWNIITAETRKRGKNKENIRPKKINLNAFNNYFLTTSENTTYNIPAKTTDNNRKYYLDLALRSPSPKIRFNNITTEETKQITSSLHQKNSYGYDEISMKILKISAPYTSSPVCYIFNEAISVGTFPSCLKYSIIKSIHKKERIKIVQTID